VAGAAGQATLVPADSALLTRILFAEDRRDTSDAAIAAGLAHRDERVRTIAQRARARITEPGYASRTSLAPLPSPRAWPEPAWRLRFRALTPQRSDCAALRTAAADSAWPVRLRAAAIAADRRATLCTADAFLAATFRSWIDYLPADASRRAQGEVSWHAGAHAIRALARLEPDAARSRMTKVVMHRQWQVRMYAVAAASALADTSSLRVLARDANNNVVEAALVALAPVATAADEELFLRAIRTGGAQAARVAARALGDTSKTMSPRAREALTLALERWTARNDASARDVRVAILAALGRPASDDKPPPHRIEALPDLAALALGADIRIRVTMSPASGGGAFTVRLRGDVAPIMAARILELVRAKYYDGLSWHRVEHDFVIQGGSPDANEYVGHKDYLRDELGTVPHVRGTVGMSTRGHDTGDAQWFVNLRDNLRLGPDYTVFAEVVDGIDVIDGILEGDVIASMSVLPRR
jgi:cyclophilin family peptidyl-prolyl cis-trans isomerase